MLIPYKKARLLAVKYEGQGFHPTHAMNRAMREIAGVPPPNPNQDPEYQAALRTAYQESLNPPTPVTKREFDRTFITEKFVEAGLPLQMAMVRADQFFRELNRSMVKHQAKAGQR